MAILYLFRLNSHIRLFIRFVHDFPDQLLQNILQRNNSARPAEFIPHYRQVAPSFLEERQKDYNLVREQKGLQDIKTKDSKKE